MSEQPVGAAQLISCDQCHHEVPALEFCVRCGDPLLAEKQRAGLSGRRSDRFAAAPGERALALHFSTLFPQLPRADMATFQIAFVIGLGVIVAFAAFGLYPVALAAALVLVPLLLILYIWEVDIYEDEPIRVLAFTGAWGLVAGGLVSLAIRALVPVESGLLQGPTTGAILLRGVLIPLIGGALMLIGPLILLPYRKFNDVLDGATFGATSAVAFVAGLGLVQSLDLFAGGLQPGGDPMPWIVRLLSLGVATPLIAAGAIGAAAGAAWLQWRAPVTDRHRLGLLGRPVVAAIAAGLLLVAAAVGQLLLPFLPALIWLGILAAIALIWLRAVIHLGLLQEAAEIDVGPEIRCPNCARLTPAHSFCGNCGFSLRAAPKTRTVPGAEARPRTQSPQARP